MSDISDHASILKIKNIQTQDQFDRWYRVFDDVGESVFRLELMGIEPSLFHLYIPLLYKIPNCNVLHISIRLVVLSDALDHLIAWLNDIESYNPSLSNITLAFSLKGDDFIKLFESLHGNTSLKYLNIEHVVFMALDKHDNPIYLQTYIFNRLKQLMMNTTITSIDPPRELNTSLKRECIDMFYSTLIEDRQLPLKSKTKSAAKIS